jgi:hypothetical protein
MQGKCRLAHELKTAQLCPQLEKPDKNSDKKGIADLYEHLKILSGPILKILEKD